MRYIKLSNEFLDFNEFIEGMCEVFIELDQSGEIQREIGINSDNKIIHKFPSNDFKYGKCGIFDLSRINLDPVDMDEIAKDNFEILWHQSSKI